MRTFSVVWQRQQNLSHWQLPSGISHWAQRNFAVPALADMKIL
jgi:hypothetical protein